MERLDGGAVGPCRRGRLDHVEARAASTPDTAASRPGRSRDGDLDAGLVASPSALRPADASLARQRVEQRSVAGDLRGVVREEVRRVARVRTRVDRTRGITDESECLGPPLLDDRSGAAPVSSGRESTPSTARRQLVEPLALPGLELAEREREDVERPGSVRGSRGAPRAGARAPRRDPRGGRPRRGADRGRTTRSTSSSSATEPRRSRSASRRASSAGSPPSPRAATDERGEHRLLGYGGAARTRRRRADRRPRRRGATSTRSKRSTWAGSSRNGIGSTPPDRLGEVGERPLEDLGGLEEPPRAHRSVAEQREQPRRRPAVPRRPVEVDLAEPVEQSGRRRCLPHQTGGVERDDERVLVGRDPRRARSSSATGASHPVAAGSALAAGGGRAGPGVATAAATAR